MKPQRGRVLRSSRSHAERGNEKICFNGYHFTHIASFIWFHYLTGDNDMSIVRLVLLTLVITACSKAPEPPTPIKIGINVWPGYAHAYIAQKKGFFEKHQVMVELQLKPDITDVIKLYRSNEIDGFFGVFSDVITINADGLPTRLVYIADYSDSGDVIIARPQFKSLQDLKGKTVSFEGVDTFSNMLVISLLAKAGIKIGEFQAVNLPASQVLETLEAGKIDAGHTWEPVTSQALAKGYKILGKAGDIPGIITDVLAFRNDVIDKRASDIQHIIQALLEAKDFASQHPDEALEIMAQAEGMSKTEMETGLKGVHQADLLENVAAMQPGGALFQSGDYIVNFYLQNGQLANKPDLGTFMERRFVIGN
jgi:NitT/TauT family transport system substrate-binding protein